MSRAHVEPPTHHASFYADWALPALIAEQHRVQHAQARTDDLLHLARRTLAVLVLIMLVCLVAVLGAVTL